MNLYFRQEYVRKWKKFLSFFYLPFKISFCSYNKFYLPSPSPNPPYQVLFLLLFFSRLQLLLPASLPRRSLCFLHPDLTSSIATKRLASYLLLFFHRTCRHACYRPPDHRARCFRSTFAAIHLTIRPLPLRCRCPRRHISCSVIHCHHVPHYTLGHT